MKRFLAIAALCLIFFSCAKKDNGPKVVQDIRGTTWLSDTEVHDGPPVGLYLTLKFDSSNDFYSGTGNCLYVSAGSAIYGGSQTSWKLDYDQDKKNKTQITLSLQDYEGKDTTLIGSWVKGVLLINGISYHKAG